MIAPGALVVCSYRPSHTGLVLAADDPRAWAGTMAFPDTSLDAPPAAEDVTAHLAKHSALGTPLGGKVPVLWSFGRVYWEALDALAPCGLGEGQDWVILRADVSQANNGLAISGVNLSDGGRPFNWLVDVERTLSEPRYDWLRCEFTDAAQRKIEAHRAMVARRHAKE